MQVCGSRCTVAIDSDGQLLSWGWNARATLGHGHRSAAHQPTRAAYSPNTLPIALLGTRGVEAQYVCGCDAEMTKRSRGGWLL